MLFMNCPELPRAVQLQPQPELTLNCSFAASTRPETTRTFQPKETLKKPEVDCSAICIIHFSDAYKVHLLSNSKFYGCIPTYSIKCILQNRDAASCLSTWAMQKGQIAPLDFVGSIDFALQMCYVFPHLFFIC